jgi:hypothetical protein
VRGAFCVTAITQRNQNKNQFLTADLRGMNADKPKLLILFLHTVSLAPQYFRQDLLW